MNEDNFGEAVFEALRESILEDLAMKITADVAEYVKATGVIPEGNEDWANWATELCVTEVENALGGSFEYADEKAGAAQYKLNDLYMTAVVGNVIVGKALAKRLREDAENGIEVPSNW